MMQNYAINVQKLFKDFKTVSNSKSLSLTKRLLKTRPEKKLKGYSMKALA